MSNTRISPMSQEEYDAIKATYPGQVFEGVLAYHWRYCSCGTPHIRDLALKLNGGGVLALPKDFTLPVGSNSCAGLPEGTKIRIEIPPGSVGPFNRFCNENMMFCVYNDQGYHWCETTDRNSLPRRCNKNNVRIENDEYF